MKKTPGKSEIPLPLDVLQSHWRDLNARYFQNKLLTIELQWSTRLTSSAGMFVNSHGPRSRQLDQPGQRCTVRLIRLSIPLLTGKPLLEIRRTLAHEMIHQWQYDVQKRHPSHGADFRRMMAVMNRDGMGIDVYHSFTKEVEALAQYAWQCTKCGQSYRRQRRTLSPRRHRCGYCQGSLQEIKLESNAHRSRVDVSEPTVQPSCSKTRRRQTRRKQEMPQQLVFDFMRY